MDLYFLKGLKIPNVFNTHLLQSNTDLKLLSELMKLNKKRTDTC